MLIKTSFLKKKTIKLAKIIKEFDNMWLYKKGIDKFIFYTLQYLPKLQIIICNNLLILFLGIYLT